MRSKLAGLGLGLGLLLPAACDAPLPEDFATARTSAPIVNGTNDLEDPATVFLDLGNAACSGTLVSRRVILTAAHCLDGAQGSIDVFFGFNPTANGTWIGTTGHMAHPSADVGMITLESPAPAEITPVPMGRANLANHIGIPMRIAGFGAIAESGQGGGIKRKGTTYLHSLPQQHILFTGAADSTSWTCYGDSGGPNFATIDGVEYVIGVTSFGTTACGAPFDGAVRTDSLIDWLDAYVAQNEDNVPPTLTVTSPADGATVLPGFVITADASDDKPGLRVEALVDDQVVGFDMSAPYEIPAPAALAPGLHTVKVRALDGGGNVVEVTRAVTVASECSVDGDCADGEVCTGGLCKGEIGTGCAAGDECVSGQCLTPDEGAKFCSINCSGDNECPSDFTCEVLMGSPARKCLPADGEGGTCGCRVGGRDTDAAGGLAALGLGLGLVLAAGARRRRRR